MRGVSMPASFTLHHGPFIEEYLQDSSFPNFF
jgi:hypothetical protein